MKLREEHLFLREIACIEVATAPFGET